MQRAALRCALALPLSPRTPSAVRFPSGLLASTTTSARCSPRRCYASKKNKRGPKAGQPDEDDPGNVPLVYAPKKMKKGKTTDELIGDKRLPGEAYDVNQLGVNMDKAIERLRTTLHGVVARVGRVSPSKLFSLCQSSRAGF
jgi:hypothetical protein